MNAAHRQYLTAGEDAGRRYALAIPREAMHGAIGYQLGHRTGSSLDFRDFREYEPGDDLRRIDWGAYARSDKLVVKLYREEVNPHLDLLLDGSRSMDLADTRKAEAFFGLAGLLAAAAANAACSHTAWLAGARIDAVPNGARSPRLWEGLALDAVTAPAAAMHRGGARWRRHGIRVFVSDLLWEDDPLAILRPFAHGAAAVTVIHLLARAEAEPDLQGNLRLADIESGGERELFIDALARQRYREALARHRQQWHNACRLVGATLVTVMAEDFVEQARRAPALERARVLMTI
jgi:uncharacterized protein (DUF58 family)